MEVLQLGVKVAVLVSYFLVVVILGFLAKRRIKYTAGEYFLAGRGLGTLVLIGTMAATNFSAFTVFGASGAGYRDGLAFFPIMAFGTGFMALTFWLIGRKVWRLGREHNLITPAELISKIYNHRGLSILFALVMVVFTVPYIALQPMAGGMVLNKLFGLHQAWGAVIVTGIILLYVLRGGLRAVAWTDVFQGLLMLGLMIAALVLVANHHGGFVSAFGKVREIHPELFSRPGGENFYSPGIWFSYMMLWFLCDPMFPQLFQRFYAAGKERSLARTMIAYPAICTVVFFLPVALGVLGRLHRAGLEGKAADQIVPIIVTDIGGDFMGTLILAAGLAALMSTMDSQLLTLSSIFTRDFFPPGRVRRELSPVLSRVFVVGLALVGLVIAMKPPATILQIATQAFTGLAVLFPVVLFGLYLAKPRPIAAIASIIAGEALVILYAFKLPPTFGFLPVVPIMIASVLTYLVVHFATGPAGLPRIRLRSWLYTGGFGLVFLLAMDFYRWNKIGTTWFGWPAWAWYFVGLSILQTVLMIFWVRGKTGDET